MKVASKRGTFNRNFKSRNESTEEEASTHRFSWTVAFVSSWHRQHYGWVHSQGFRHQILPVVAGIHVTHQGCHSRCHHCLDPSAMAPRPPYFPTSAQQSVVIPISHPM